VLPAFERFGSSEGELVPPFPVDVFESDAGVEVGAVLTSGVLVGALPGELVGTAESKDCQ